MYALAVSLLLLALTIAGPAAAFDLRFDRFVVDGNAFGPAGGGPDLTDDLDDGALAPNWQPFTGTVSESGGFLHTTDPGGVTGINGDPSTT